MYTPLNKEALQAELSFDSVDRTWSRNDGTPVVAKFDGSGYRCIEVMGHFFRQATLEVLYTCDDFQTYGGIPYAAYLDNDNTVRYF